MILNPLDWFLLGLVLYSAVRAALNGFFREAFTLAGFLLGLPLACWYYRDLAHALSGLLSSPPVAQFTAFLLILIAITVTASLLGRTLRHGARTVGLGFADRLGGALFGALRGVGVAAALLLAISAFLPTAPWIVHSSLAPYLLHGAHAVSFAMPVDLRQRLADALTHLNHSTPRWIKPGPLSHTRFTTLQP